MWQITPDSVKIKSRASSFQDCSSRPIRVIVASFRSNISTIISMRMSDIIEDQEDSSCSSIKILTLD